VPRCALDDGFATAVVTLRVVENGLPTLLWRRNFAGSVTRYNVFILIASSIGLSGAFDPIGHFLENFF
jgi:hypothetical protein